MTGSKLLPQIIFASAAGAVIVSTALFGNQSTVYESSFSPGYVVAPLPSDSPPANLQYPIEDQPASDYFGGENNAFNLNDPSAISDSLVYDPETGGYIYVQKIGDEYYRDPEYISFEDYLNEQSQKDITDYWIERSNAINLLGRPAGEIKLNPNGDKGCRIFGGCDVSIKPQGNIEMSFGGSFQNVENPILTEQQRKQGGFDFDMNIDANVLGQIGDKLKLTFNYNTQATFDFQNQVKLEYTGHEDEIIQKIEAGNVSLPLTTQLIPGTQSLFGIKTELQFGRLTATLLASQQKSQTQSIQIEGGAQKRDFEISADQYDENRHFFLGHYFRNNYESWLATLPYINSPVNITRIEVWVTNTTGETQNTRDIAAFADLGESDSIHQTAYVHSAGAGAPPSNYANDLYTHLYNNPSARELNTVVSTLTSPTFGMHAVEDFEKTRMRKLEATDYTYNAQLGFISLNTTLQADDVLAVAYEYTINGQVYQVGEFSTDLPPGVDTSNVLYMKMLKSTSEQTQLPIWDLMMKNVYSLGAFQISPDDFQLDILYQDPGGGLKRYIPAANSNVNGKPLIQLEDLDRLNTNLDPQPDGRFDFVTGITINPTNGRVYFPVLEPFGTHMRSPEFFGGDIEVEKYAYDELYSQTKTVALQYPQYDRYILKGSYKSSVSSEIYLGAFNLPHGSVTVTANGQLLQENIDYTIDYSLGRLKIINESILNSGAAINVSFENNAFYGFQTKSLLGGRFDYRINDNFVLGATVLHLSERPFTQKVNIGDDPISNTMVGFDLNYTKDAPWLTRVLDRLPIYDTKEQSTITVSGEVAKFIPGHSKAIGKGNEGTIYIDDFEGSSSAYDLKFPFSAWVLASTPQNAVDQNGDELFPESLLFNNRDYGKNRARMAWYNIDPLFLDDNNPSQPDYISAADLSNVSVHQFDETDIFPAADFAQGTPTNLSTFDLAYYPNERGPYNFDASATSFSAGMNPNGYLNQPATRWGGIMRSLETNDFEAANIQYIQLWVLDPYDNKQVVHPNSDGYLYIDLGNVSEDVLKDSRMFFENGLPKDGSGEGLDQTVWGNVPRVLPITNAFDNDPASRENQDKGFDGLNDGEEDSFFTDYINALVAGSPAYNNATNDPSADDYHYYRGTDYDDTQVPILTRYKKYNNPEGNSPTTESSPEAYPTAETTLPETEDLNKDYTLNETESYFQYRVPFAHDMTNNPYVTDVVATVVDFPDGTSDTVNWYQLKIPIEQYDAKIGAIQDFKSIRFMRMFLTGFDTTVYMRFARLELIRNQWRTYEFSLLNPGEYIPDDNDASTEFNLTSVSIEENSERVPVPYAVPPGVEREQTLGSGNSVATYQQNEQALSLQVCALKDGDSRAIFKPLEIDLRKYGRLIMNVHGEPLVDAPSAYTDMQDGDLQIFLRLGSDFTNNYYEYAVPLKLTKLPLPPGTTEDDAVREAIWATLINFPLDSLVQVKQLRNSQNISPLTPYLVPNEDGSSYTIIGNPDLGYVEEVMIGIRNPKEVGGSGQAYCAEVWVNELRLTDIDEKGGYAALGRVETKLADLGSFVVSGNMHTVGFGTLEQQIDERYKDNFYQYAASLTLELGKFLPSKLGIRLPLYASISQSFSNPEFDPYELDVDLNDKVNEITTAYGADSAKQYKRSVIDYQAVKSINLTNVRIERDRKGATPHLWDPENWDLTLAYSEEYNSNPTLEYDKIKRYKGAIGYNFATKGKFITPFERIIDKKYKWLQLIRDFNFNLLPTGYSFRTELNRQFGETLMRDIYGDGLIAPTFDKYFDWDRFYGLKLEPSKSIKIDFSATNNARIDEPYGRLDTKEKRDTVWQNFYDLGRNIHYSQTLGISYNVPINKIPVFSWITLRTSYNTSYSWTAGSLGIVDTLGNVIGNTQARNINGEFNFRNLYNKSKFLKTYNGGTTGGNKAIPDKTKGKTGDEDTEEDTGDKAGKKKETQPGGGIGGVGMRLVLSLKRITVNYTKNYGTTIPGFMPVSQVLGMNLPTQAPGWDFVFGYQPSYKWLDSAATKGWLSTAPSLNALLAQTYSQNLDIRANLEPLQDFRLDINLTKTYSKNHSEYFKNTNTIDDPEFNHLNGVDNGSLTMSYSIFGTVFEKLNSTDVTATFKQFEANRAILTQRWQNANFYSDSVFYNPLDSTFLPNYSEGYGPYSQDVLIPAFLAAYTGQDAHTISLNVFDQTPKPNYHVTYTGLNKIGNLRNTFTSITISSAYTSTLAVNSFATDLDFDGNYYLYGHVIDTLTGNFVSLYSIPNIILNESLEPLFGIDASWVNGLTTKFEYKKSRTLTMSFIDYQLTETHSNEFTIGLGYKMDGLTFPFKIRGKRPNLKNDITFKFDMDYRDDITTNFRLDQDLNEPTGGMKLISFSPTIDYVVNDKFNIQLYFDRQRTIPKISTSYPITTTNAGIKVRFTLSE